jgi:hypothetical protein
MALRVDPEVLASLSTLGPIGQPGPRAAGPPPWFRNVRPAGDGVSAGRRKPPKPADQRLGYAPGNWVRSTDPIDETPIITCIATTFGEVSIRRGIIRRVAGSKGCTVIEPRAAFWFLAPSGLTDDHQQIAPFD